MTTTGKLIEQLASDLDTGHRLPRPWCRTACWLVLSLLFVALVVILASPRADLTAKLSEQRFLIEQGAALSTGIAAAYAAFVSTIPGMSRRLLLLPLLPLAIWLGSLGQGCLDTLVRIGPQGLTLYPDWLCFPAILTVGSLPAVAMVMMLRRGAPLSPHLTAALGGLAAAGLGNVGLRMFHPQDASVMVLVWQVGSVLILAALAGCIGHRLFNWTSIAARSMRRRG